MHDDGLFADLRQPQPAPPAVSPDRLADWQVAALRRALDDAGATAMVERQLLIERHAGRPVAALHDLSAVEARTVLEALISQKQSAVDGPSNWDDRDGDTWIDRL